MLVSFLADTISEKFILFCGSMKWERKVTAGSCFIIISRWVFVVCFPFLHSHPTQPLFQCVLGRPQMAHMSMGLSSGQG